MNADPPGLQGWRQEGNRGDRRGTADCGHTGLPEAQHVPTPWAHTALWHFQQMPQGLSSLPVGPVLLTTLKIKEPKDLQSENPDLFSEVDSSENIK